MSDLLLEPGSEIKIERYAFPFVVQIVLGERLAFDVSKNLDEGVEFEPGFVRSNVLSRDTVKLTAIYIDDIEVFSGKLDASDIFVDMNVKDPILPFPEATKMLCGRQVKKSMRIVGEYTGLVPRGTLKMGDAHAVAILMSGPASFKS